MALPLISLLTTVDDKVTEISNLHRQLHQRIKALEEEKEDLRRELDETRARLRKAELDVEFLTMSHRLADSPDSIISTRRHIARLIRNIDSCISMLKEE